MMLSNFHPAAVASKPVLGAAADLEGTRSLRAGWLRKQAAVLEEASRSLAAAIEPKERASAELPGTRAASSDRLCGLGDPADSL